MRKNPQRCGDKRIVFVVGIIVLLGMLIYSAFYLRERYTACPSVYSITMEDGTKYDTLMPSLSDKTVNSDGSLKCRYGSDCKSRNMLFCGNPFKSRTTCSSVATVIFGADDTATISDALIADDSCKKNVGWPVTDDKK